MQTKIDIIGLPNLAAIMGAKTHIEWPGGTLDDMITWLAKSHGPKVQQMLLDERGRLDASIQVTVNAEGFMAREKIRNRILGDGDSVSFILLAGGG